MFQLAGLPIGSLVVPFLGITLKDPKYEPQKGTTLEPMGGIRESEVAGSAFRLLSASVQSSALVHDERPQN